MATQAPQEQETAVAIYNRLKEERNPYVKRAERCASLTIPALFPKDGTTASTEFQTPCQSLGARGVNNLASKILLALMPPTTAFFRLDVGDEAKKTMANKQQAQVADVMNQVQYELSKIEQFIMRYLEVKQFRVTISEGIKQLLISGNYLFFLPPKEGGIKGYRLNNYVVERDGLGKIYRIIALDLLSYATLSPSLKALIDQKGEHKPNAKVKVYTHTWLEAGEEGSEGTYFSEQYLEDELIAGSEQSYPESKTPWIAIRMLKIDGENYARSYVEEILGDLVSVEGLSKAILEFSAVASRIVFLVNPNGQTQAKRLANAETGDYIAGRKQDVEAMTLDKVNDFQVTKATLDGLKGELALSFLLNSAVQRNAERVTAEEIRYVARELEDTLGGIYSILSQELQLPLIRVVMSQLQSSGLLADFPKGIIEPSITTGLEALGRGHDLDKLDQFLKYLMGLPEAIRYMKTGEFLKTIATSLSIDVTGLIRSDEEVQQMQQQEQQALMAQQVAPKVVDGAMKQAQQ